MLTHVIRYRCINGAPWTSLLAVSVQLCDHRRASFHCPFITDFLFSPLPRLALTDASGWATAASASCAAVTSLICPCPTTSLAAWTTVSRSTCACPIPKIHTLFRYQFNGGNRYQPVTQAGDVVVWSEATVHGATPWQADHQRRIALYRFSPANMGYGRGYLEVDPARLEGMTDAQRAVLQPPYVSHP